MLEFDEQKAAEIIMRENPDYPRDTALTVARNLKKVHPALYHVIKAWLDGKYIPFRYKGLTIKKIRKKFGGSYSSAMFIFSYYLEHPNEIMEFKKRKLWKDCVLGD